MNATKTVTLACPFCSSVNLNFAQVALAAAHHNTGFNYETGKLDVTPREEERRPSDPVCSVGFVCEDCGKVAELNFQDTVDGVMISSKIALRLRA